jgi:hypothetical protein
MNVNRTSRIVVTGLFLVMVSPVSSTQGNRTSYAPMSQQHSSQQKDGFVDFTLKQINPCDTDYGQHLDEDRRMVLQESIESAYFWSNIASLGLLGCLFIIIIYQHGVQGRREWGAAEMLTQYEHSLLLANARVEEATKRNCGLMEALTLLRESALRSPALAADIPDHPRVPAPRSRVASTPPLPASPAKENPAKPTPASTVSTATTTPASATKPSSQIGLFKPEADLVMKVNSLEQQLGRSREEAKLLRRQVNEADQRAQAEEQKNRVLKGE